MTTQVERAFGLEALGIVRSGRVHWNLSPAALYEQALARGEASLAAEGPLVARTGQHTGRSPNDKFVVKEPASEKHVHWGTVNKPIDEAKFDALHKDMMAYLQDKDLFVLDAWGGTDPKYKMPIRVVNEFAWHNLFARNMFLPENDPAKRREHRPEFTVIDAPKFKADPAKHGTRSEVLHPRALRPQDGPHRRHPLRRRNQEVDLHHPQLHAAAAGRALDALLGQHRRGRRHRALLRPLGHRQDDALERSAPPADWRRRARLERHRRLQLRGRLLRQGDQAVAGGRAADLRDDAALRHHPRERRHRSRAAHARPRRRVAHREHAQLVSDHLHRQRRALRPRRSPDERRDADGRRLRRAAADRAPHVPRARCTTSSPATPHTWPAPRRA